MEDQMHLCYCPLQKIIWNQNLFQLIVMYKFLFDNVKEIDNLEIGYKHEFMFTTKQHIQYDKFKTVVIDIV